MMRLIDLITKWLNENQYTIDVELYGLYSRPDFHIVSIGRPRRRGFMVLENKIQVPDIHSAGIVEIFAHDSTIFEKLKNYLDAPKVWAYVSPDSHTYVE